MLYAGKICLTNRIPLNIILELGKNFYYYTIIIYNNEIDYKLIKSRKTQKKIVCKNYMISEYTF